MEENPSALTAVEVGELADAFEKTALEIAILESVHGLRCRSGSAADRVKRVFRASVDELRRTGTLNAMVACTARDGRVDGPCANAERPRDDGGRAPGPPWRRHVSVAEKRLRTLKRTEEQVDLATEMCTVSTRSGVFSIFTRGLAVIIRIIYLYSELYSIHACVTIP